MKNLKKYSPIIVTGGAGFIGSNFVLEWFNNFDIPLVNIDLLTYAGNLQNLEALQNYSNHHFIKGDICDQVLVASLFEKYQPQAIINFAAESHVDRSISNPESFIKTNIHGTYTLLEVARNYWAKLEDEDKNLFRFIHISTDEVYGSLSPEEPPFTEQNPYQPNSPYSSSKAASDHLVRAWNHTYGLPVITTNCSNNYGPYQFPEKLIPLIIFNAISGKEIPIYGDGKNIRDWLFVTDHCAAIRQILTKGKIGETYNIGGHNEITNIEIAQIVCGLLDELHDPKKHDIRHFLTEKSIESYHELIKFVPDRLGHDRRYAIDSSKVMREVGWRPSETFNSGITKTIQWYLNNIQWIRNIETGAYKNMEL
ncbi:MAG: dTDP-glucose 4,6-dehydratase [Rickettsiales bacterium]|nr:MAG: dTDP-glucose 4,6-dehydratase [Rickettsiales bacterium]